MKNPEKLDKYYNTQPNKIPFRNSNMRKTMWYLDQPNWEVYFKLDGYWSCLIIYGGFVSDLASIPWLIQPLLRKGKDGVHRSFSTFHDYLYVLPKFIRNGKRQVFISHETCSHQFYQRVGSKWVPSDVFMTKKQVDDISFKIWETTPNSWTENWKKFIISTSFRTPFANILWKKNWEIGDINPLRCR